MHLLGLAIDAERDDLLPSLGPLIPGRIVNARQVAADQTALRRGGEEAVG